MPLTRTRNKQIQNSDTRSRAVTEWTWGRNTLPGNYNIYLLTEPQNCTRRLRDQLKNTFSSTTEWINLLSIGTSSVGDYHGAINGTEYHQSNYKIQLETKVHEVHLSVSDHSLNLSIISSYFEKCTLHTACEYNYRVPSLCVLARSQERFCQLDVPI